MKIVVGNKEESFQEFKDDKSGEIKTHPAVTLHLLNGDIVERGDPRRGLGIVQFRGELSETIALLRPGQEITISVSKVAP